MNIADTKTTSEKTESQHADDIVAKYLADKLQTGITLFRERNMMSDMSTQFTPNKDGEWRIPTVTDTLRNWVRLGILSVHYLEQGGDVYFVVKNQSFIERRNARNAK